MILAVKLLQIFAPHWISACALWIARSPDLGDVLLRRGASGNVATEDVVYMMQREGLAGEIDFDSLVRAGEFIAMYWIGAAIPKRRKRIAREKRISIKIREGNDDEIESPILQVDNLSLRFGGLQALDGVSFAVARGDLFPLSGQTAREKLRFLIACPDAIVRRRGGCNLKAKN